MKKDDKNRRNFLKSLLVGSAVAAGVTATGVPVKSSARTGSTAIPEVKTANTETLYRETEAFKQYYQSLGYQADNS